MAIFCSGCLIQSTAVVRGNRAGVDGAGLGAESILSKLRFAVESGYEEVPAETAGDDAYGVFAIDHVVRFGFVAALIEDRCESKPKTHNEYRFCHADPGWFEIGPAAALGYGFSRDGLVGHGWVGVWADVRVWPSKRGPLLRLEVQADDYYGPMDGGTQFTIGLGYITESESKGWLW